MDEVPASVVVKSENSGVSRKLIPFLLLLLIVLLGIGVGLWLWKNKAGSTAFGDTPSDTVTLTYWGLWEPNNIMQPLFDEFQAQNPNIKIDYKLQSPSEYRERLATFLSKNEEAPDIFRIHNTWVPMFKQFLSSVPASVFSAADFESAFFPAAKNDLRLGNNYVAIPLMYDGLAMYVNDDLLAQGGKAVPQLWTDLRKTAVELSACDSEDGRCSSGKKILVAGTAMGTADNVDHWQEILTTLMLQNNVNLNSPTAALAEEPLKFYTVFNSEDHIWDSTLPNSTTMFTNGKLVFYFAPSWRIFEIKQFAPNLKFSVYPMPQLALDISRGEKPVTLATYWAEAVNKKSTKTVAAWKLVKFLSNKETLMKMYQTASVARGFGEIYPYKDMLETLKTAPLVGPFASSAESARTWYLASNTFDGAGGINSRLSTYFADAINSINQGGSSAEAIKTLSLGINQVLSKYGLATQLTAPAN